MNKEIIQKDFNEAYNYHKEQGKTNKETAEIIGMSIRSFYYYKKGVVPTRETKITKRVENEVVIIRRKRKPPPPPPPIEAKFLFRCRCKVDDETDYKKDKTYSKVVTPLGTLTEHYFTWVGSGNISDELATKQAIKVHRRWKNHELKEIDIIERD